MPTNLKTPGVYIEEKNDFLNSEVAIETSIKESLILAARAYVFEPNNVVTWVTVKSVLRIFLTNLWKQGVLAGSSPEDAFDVQVGLGTTMTPNDILDGIMRITVKVAIVHPAEFTMLTFQQQMQQS